MRASFSQYNDECTLDKDVRSNSKLEPFGALGDLGWYCIRVGLLAFSGLRASDFTCGKNLDHKWKMLPRKVTARCSRWSSEVCEVPIV